MTIVVLDTETTGFGHMKGRQDAIIQIGLAWKKNDKLETWQSLCRPDEYYIANADPEALRVNGVTAEMIRGAPSEEYVARWMHSILNWIGDDIELRAYNVAFDRPFVAKHPWNLDHKKWGPCIMLQATRPNERWPKLKVACERYGIDPSGPLHSAGHDARLAYLLMEALNAKTV